MQVILKEAHGEHEISVGESVEVRRIGRSPVRVFRLRAKIDEIDISQHVVTPGMKPLEAMENARRYLRAVPTV